MFKLTSQFEPTGDQPEAIKELTQGLLDEVPGQVLLGVTGSGKTFTMANVIQKLNKPTLLIAHNKTLAAQLYGEMKEFNFKCSMQSASYKKAKKIIDRWTICFEECK